MSSPYRIKLVRVGGHQVARIPREVELAGEEVVMRRDGPRLIIEPARASSLLARLAALRPIDDEVPPIADWPPDPLAP